MTGVTLLKWVDAADGPKQQGVADSVIPNALVHVGDDVASEMRRSRKELLISLAQVSRACSRAGPVRYLAGRSADRTVEGREHPSREIRPDESDGFEHDGRSVDLGLFLVVDAPPPVLSPGVTLQDCKPRDWSPLALAELRIQSKLGHRRSQDAELLLFAYLVKHLLRAVCDICLQRLDPCFSFFAKDVRGLNALQRDAKVPAMAAAPESPAE